MGVDLPAFAAGRDLCPPFEPAPIATGPSSVADGYLQVSADAYGSWAVPFGGGPGPLGDVFNPVGTLPTAEVAFVDGFFLFHDTQRELLSTSADWQATVGDDSSLAREVMSGIVASDTDGDGVDDTATSAFHVFGGTTNLSFDQVQHVEQVTGTTTVAVLTQEYTITNNSASAIDFELVRVLNGDLVWSGNHTNDSVGTGTNGSPLERFVYTQEVGDAATAITLSSPTGDAYVGGKRGVDPDGPGGSPPYGFGRVSEVWNAFGVPAGWRNHIAGVGYNTNGDSGAAPPGSIDPRDAFVILEIPVSLPAEPGTSINVTIRHTYGATTPVVPCPWDCGDGDGTVGIVDYLALLIGWGQPGPCDFDGGGVGDVDQLKLLGNWGPCP